MILSLSLPVFYMVFCIQGGILYTYIPFLSIFKGRRYFADLQFSRVVSVPINRDNRDLTVTIQTWELQDRVCSKQIGCTLAITDETVKAVGDWNFIADSSQPVFMPKCKIVIAHFEKI